MSEANTVPCPACGEAMEPDIVMCWECYRTWKHEHVNDWPVHLRAAIRDRNARMAGVKP